MCLYASTHFTHKGVRVCIVICITGHWLGSLPAPLHILTSQKLFKTHHWHQTQQRHLYCSCHSNQSVYWIFPHLQVIQLVRDPRGILASRMETFRDTYRLWRLWRATGHRPHNLDLGQIRTVCEDFLRSVSMGLAKPAWLRGRYILLRWEGQ